MAVQVLVTVDLNQVTERQREIFRDEMKARQWIKLSLTTTWKARFQEGASASSALSTTANEVRQCAQAAGISRYEMAAQAGDQEPLVSNER